MVTRCERGKFTLGRLLACKQLHCAGLDLWDAYVPSELGPPPQCGSMAATHLISQPLQKAAHVFPIYLLFFVHLAQENTFWLFAKSE
eukprot:1652116-Pleurochrysis_carterae.AAC.3